MDQRLWYPPELDLDDGTAGYTAEQYDAAYKEGKAICNACPVRLDCLEWGMTNKERWGLIGGLHPLERLRVERKARRGRLQARRAKEAAEGSHTGDPDDSRIEQ